MAIRKKQTTEAPKKAPAQKKAPEPDYKAAFEYLVGALRWRSSHKDLVDEAIKMVEG